MRDRLKNMGGNWISILENPALICRGADRKFSRQITKCNFLQVLGDERLDILSVLHNS